MEFSFLVFLRAVAILDKAKPNTENIRGLNLAAVKRTAVQVSIAVVA
jgi:hypothetical protein